MQLFGGVTRHNNKTLYDPTDREWPARDDRIIIYCYRYIYDVYWLAAAAARFTCPVVRVGPINASGRGHERADAFCELSAAPVDSSEPKTSFPRRRYRDNYYYYHSLVSFYMFRLGHYILAMYACSTVIFELFLQLM